MPADPCAGSIFGDKHLLEFIAIEVGEPSRGCAQFQEKTRNLLSLLKLSHIEVITPAERDYPSLAQKASKLEFPEAKLCESLYKSALLVRR
jgi:hypothetical protein